MTGSLYDLSTTAADNDDALLGVGVDFREGQSPGSVNNSIRAQLAAIRAFLTNLGIAASGGSANAYTITSPGSFTLSAYVSGVRFGFIANHSNSGAATLAVDALAAKAITKNGTTALVTGDLVSGRYYEVVYDGTQFQLAGEKSTGVYQPLDATLTAWGALSFASGQIGYATGSDTFALADTQSFGRSLLNAANLAGLVTALGGAAATATALGLGTGDSPQFTAINVGNASDTTLSRNAAGLLQVESNIIPHVGYAATWTQTQTFSGGVTTGAAIRISMTTPTLFWDETDQASGAKRWYQYVGSSILHFAIADDSGGSLTDWLTVTRTTGAISSIVFGNAVQIPTIELGHASDTTLARSAAGRVSVEGAEVLLAGAQQISLPATAFTPRTTNGAAQGTSETSTNKVMLKTLDFDASTDEFAQIMLAMPKSWNEGTITAQFIWTATNTGNVIWGIQGVALSDDDAADTAFGTAQTVTDAVTAANDIMISSATSAVTIGGSPAEGDLICLQVYRDADAGGDTCAVDAKLIAVRLTITLNAANDA